jgi:hypothetical protein
VPWILSAKAYTYTVNNRLQGASGSRGCLTYTQDGVGNRTQEAFGDGH